MRLSEVLNPELLAPNGHKSHLNKMLYHQVRTPEFKAWFGDWENNPNSASKVLDDNGEPLVVYHKTNVDFKSFDIKKVGKSDYGYAGRGFYFLPVPLRGLTYGNITMPVFLSLKNPYIRTDHNWNTSELDPYDWISKHRDEYDNPTQASEEWTKLIKSKGYDGFIDNTGKGGEIVAFYPNQIKSAMGNSGKFSNSDNIDEGKL